MSSYTMKQFVSDWNHFNSQFDNEYQAASSDLINGLTGMESISNDDFNAAMDAYYQSTEQSLNIAIDSILNSSSVSNDPVASSMWQDIKSFALDMWEEFKDNAFGTIGRGGATKEEIDIICREAENLNAFALLTETPIASEGKNPLVLLANILMYRDDIKAGLAGIKDWFESFFISAQQFLRTVFADPLVLDMDGDGIETVAAKEL